jgi:transcriptional regulator
LHLRGRLTRLPDDVLRDHLDRLSADQERRLLPKMPWTVPKMTPDARDRLMRQIVPLRTTMTKSTATWKLGQNKPGKVRARAAEAVTGAPSGQEVAALSGLMRDPPR